jgi:hypothetical protein
MVFGKTPKSLREKTSFLEAAGGPVTPTIALTRA